MTRHRATSARTARAASPSVLLMATLAVVLALAGCGPVDRNDPPTPGSPVGDIIATWVQESTDTAGPTPDDDLPLILGSQAAWEEWLAGLPPHVSTELEAQAPEVDFSTHLLVVHSAWVCQETFSLVSPGPRTLQIVVTEPDELVACAWSPQHVMVFSVELAEIGASSAEEVSLRR